MILRVFQDKHHCISDISHPWRPLSQRKMASLVDDVFCLSRQIYPFFLTINMYLILTITSETLALKVQIVLYAQYAHCEDNLLISYIKDSFI